MSFPVRINELSCPYFDTDDYFWLKTNPPFRERRLPAERNTLLSNDLHSHSNWLLGGSIIHWGEQWLTAFDVAIFVWTPPVTRITRLQKRELERYGTIIFEDKERKRHYDAFITWASDYDFGKHNTGRTRAAHEMWMKKLACPLLRIEDEATIDERVKVSLEFIRLFSTKAP
jgi:adenylate kinase family enzyme